MILQFFQGVLTLLIFALILISLVLFTNWKELKVLYPDLSTPQAILAYFKSPQGKHAKTGIIMFTGVGALIFGLMFIAPNASSEDIELFSSARIELGAIRAPGNAYSDDSQDALAPEWVSHGVLSISALKWKCIDVNAILWFHQSGAFSRDLRTLDGSGVTMSCTIPLVSY